MLMLDWQRPHGSDGWWPKLSPAGTFVACGGGGEPPLGPQVRVLSMSTGDVVFHTDGRLFGWISPTTILYTVESVEGPQGLTWTVGSPGPKPMGHIAPSLLDGNWVGAVPGYWATVLDKPEGRLVINGQIVDNGCRGLSMRGPWLVTSGDGDFAIYRKGQLYALRHQPRNANDWRVGNAGDIGFGYHGPATLLLSDQEQWGREWDASVTSPPQEQPPLVIETGSGAWVFSCADDYVFCRPIERRGVDAPCIALKQGWVWLDMVWANGRFFLVGCSDTGQVGGVTFLPTAATITPREIYSGVIPVPTKVTITAPEFPVEAEINQGVRCVYTTTQGEDPAFVEWLATGPNNSVALVRNPGWDHDHTFRLSQPGRWAVTLRAFDAAGVIVDQTGKLREILVKDAPTPPIEPPESGSGEDGESVPDGSLPSREEARYWRGRFVDFPNYPRAFMYPGWSAEKRSAFRAAYRAAGYRHLIMGIWGAYPGETTFDYRKDPEGYLAILNELYREGIWPCVMLHTDAVGTTPAWTRDELTWWATGYLPRIKHRLVMAATGFEFNQIDQGSGVYWTGNGEEHAKWAEAARLLLGPSVLLYAHFSPERITGWPNYPDHSGPQDEAGWWKRVDRVIDGLLAQRSPEEPVEYLLAHWIGGRAPNGEGVMEYDKGDARRIGRDWGVQKDFVAAEFTNWRQPPERHGEIERRLKGADFVYGVG